MLAGIHETVGCRLAGADQRYTAGRRMLVEALASAGRPLTVPEIVAAHPELPQSTTYRNVTSLVEIGVLRRVSSTGDHDRFELAEELSGHHHHLVCAGCGRVEDVLPSAQLERTLRDAARSFALERGFDVAEHRLDVLGRCRACQLAAGDGAEEAGRAEGPAGP